MTAHSFHPDSHEYGLADDCPRCDELAQRPLELDDENLIRAWSRMIEVEFDDQRGYPSANEAKLGRRLYEIALFLQRYTPVDPRELPEHLARRREGRGT